MVHDDLSRTRPKRIPREACLVLPRNGQYGILDVQLSIQHDTLSMTVSVASRTTRDEERNGADALMNNAG